MTISGRRTEQVIIAGFFSATSLDLRVIFSVHSCGTYSVLSQSPSIVGLADPLGQSLVTVGLSFFTDSHSATDQE